MANKRRVVTYSAEALASEMARTDISPTAMAARIGIAEVNIRRYMTGERMPRIERIREMGEILGVEWR